MPTRLAMKLFAAITCTTFFGTVDVLGLNQEAPAWQPSKIRGDVGQQVQVMMTREDDLKEVEVSISQKYLNQIKERRMWRVEIELEEKVEGGQDHDSKNRSKDSNGTLLNVGRTRPGHRPLSASEESCSHSQQEDTL